MISERETADALDTGEPQVHGDKPWLITFADLFCVLLAFFALMFSMSKVETGKWKNLTQAFSQSVERPLSTDKTTAAPSDAGGLKTEPGLDLGYLGNVLEAQGKSNVLLQKAAIYMAGERLVLSLPSDLLFTPGNARFDARTEAALFDLAGVLRNIGNDVEVIGHSDPTPVENAYASNWDLSLARAVAVAGELKRAGFPRDVAAFGDADSHFSEIPADLPMPRRLELARRVDIVLTPRQGAL
jgi:chemotaxis protein MotB